MERASSGMVVGAAAGLTPTAASVAAEVVDARSLHVLRHWIRANVAGSPDALADAQLVCTELVSNSIEHARGPRRVRLTASPEHTLTIEVDDTSPDIVLTPGSSRLGANRGRGLLIVEAMSRWGVHQGVAGKTVWAVLDLD